MSGDDRHAPRDRDRDRHAPRIRARERHASSRARAVAVDCIEAGIEAAHPHTAVAERVAREGAVLRVADATYDRPEYDEVVVLGGGAGTGHAAAGLASTLGDALDGGVVVTDDPLDLDRVEVIGATDRAAEGARRIRERALAADERTLVLAVVADGDPGPWDVPGGDLAPADLRSAIADLLAAGAPPEAVAAVRGHASALAGGGLAGAAAPARVVGLYFGAAAGEDPGDVAGGPTAPDGTTYAEALGALDAHDVAAPSVRAHLEAGAEGDRPETPGPGDPALAAVDDHVLTGAWTAIEGARRAARERGFAATVLSASVTGGAREATLEHLAAAEAVREHGTPVAPPAVILSGGTTTDEADRDGGRGRDGADGGAGAGSAGTPNRAFALAAALGLRLPAADAPVDLEAVTVAAVEADGRDGEGRVEADGRDGEGRVEADGRDGEGTVGAADGDGTTVPAGALVDGDTVDDPASARAALESGDAGAYLDDRGALLVTGPTGAAVGDLRVVVVE